MNLGCPFVRIPTHILETLFRARLTGSHHRILLWVMRQTFGWNRRWTPFTWYRVAKDLGLDRPTVYRSGNALLEAKILIREGRQIGVQMDCELWNPLTSRREIVAAGQRAATAANVSARQQAALARSNAISGGNQPYRWRQATLFRRAKDNDKPMTYIKTGSHTRREEHGERAAIAANRQRPPLAGAAHPIPGKYDCLSQN